MAGLFMAFSNAKIIMIGSYGKEKKKQVVSIKPEAKEWEEGNEKPFCFPAVSGLSR